MRELTPLWPDAPRYLPEVPWPPYRFVAGLHPHPVRDPDGHAHGIEEAAVHVPPERWREDRAYLRGIDLYHAGYLWEAHEQWESIWKASPLPEQRDFLQGLIQLAAALIKVHAGNEHGARKLAARAKARFERVPSPFMGIETPFIEDLAWNRAPRLRLSQR